MSLTRGEGALGGTLKFDDIFVRVAAGRLAEALTDASVKPVRYRRGPDVNIQALS